LFSIRITITAQYYFLSVQNQGDVLQKIRYFATVREFFVSLNVSEWSIERVDFSWFLQCYYSSIFTLLFVLHRPSYRATVIVTCH